MRLLLLVVHYPYISPSSYPFFLKDRSCPFLDKVSLCAPNFFISSPMVMNLMLHIIALNKMAKKDITERVRWLTTEWQLKEQCVIRLTRSKRHENPCFFSSKFFAVLLNYTNVQASVEMLWPKPLLLFNFKLKIRKLGGPRDVLIYIQISVEESGDVSVSLVIEFDGVEWVTCSCIVFTQFELGL